jgi:hypothetical protein
MELSKEVCKWNYIKVFPLRLLSSILINFTLRLISEYVALARNVPIIFAALVPLAFEFKYEVGLREVESARSILSNQVN